MSSRYRSPVREASHGLRALPGATAKAASVLLLGCLGACGVGPQTEPVVVSTPPRIVAPAPTAAVTGEPLSMQVYLLHGSDLHRVIRTAPAGPGLEPTLTALAAPLSGQEREEGLRSALPASLQPLRGVLAAGGVAEIEAPPGFDRLPVREQIAAMGQLVFTVTANTLATAVQLEVGDHPVAAPDATGQLLNRPVTRSDYAALDPPVLSTPDRS